MDQNTEFYEECAKLVARFKAGDTVAFELLFTKTERTVYAICYSALDNAEEARDLMQEVYLYVYQNIDSLKDDRAFVAWVKTIAYSKACDLKKKKSYHDTAFDDAVASDESLLLDDDLESLPDAYVMDRAKRDALYKIIKESLSYVQFQTIHMYYYGELSVEDIAKSMNCPEGTVKTRLMKSRAKIKEGVKKYEKDNKDAFAGAPAVPFLTRFFNASAEDLSVPIINISSIAGTATKAAIKGGAGSASSSSVAVKIAAGILILALPITAAIVIKNLPQHDTVKVEREETEAETEVEKTMPYTEESVETAAPTPMPTDTPTPTPTPVPLAEVGVATDYVESRFIELSSGQNIVYPYILIDSDYCNYINEEFFTHTNNLIEDVSTDGFFAFPEPDYSLFLTSEGCLTIIQKFYYPNDYVTCGVYNINVLTGEIMTNSEMAEIAGVDSIRQAGLEALQTYYNNHYTDASGNPLVVDYQVNPENSYAIDFAGYFPELVGDSLSEEYINDDMRIGLTDDSEMFFAAYVMTPGGGHTAILAMDGTNITNQNVYEN